jgi:hypothetical protein
MTKKDLIKVMVIAAITAVSVSLPGYLYLRGLPLPWAAALLAGYILVAILGYALGPRSGT